MNDETQAADPIADTVCDPPLTQFQDCVHPLKSLDLNI